MPTKEIRNGLEILREYVDAAGKPVTSVKLGEEVEVRLKVRTVDRASVDNVAIVELLPGGFEVVLEPRARKPAEPKGRENAEGDEDPEENAGPALGSAASTWKPDFADVREDRVVLYGWVIGDTKQFVYRIKATNAGQYTVPPAYADAMYERGVTARSLAGKIAVEAPAK
jgi:uncharacterized protein YfaS (alpha-2-macroglobulin family)